MINPLGMNAKRYDPAGTTGYVATLIMDMIIVSSVSNCNVKSGLAAAHDDVLWRRHWLRLRDRDDVDCDNTTKTVTDTNRPVFENNLRVKIQDAIDAHDQARVCTRTPQPRPEHRRRSAWRSISGGACGVYCDAQQSSSGAPAAPLTPGAFL